jgi:hypothetical protein
LGNALSSTIQARTGPAAVIAGSTAARTAFSRPSASQGDWPTKCSKA